MSLFKAYARSTTTVNAGNFSHQHALSLVASRSHDISNNETLCRQNLQVGIIAKSMTPSEGNSVLLPTNVDRRPPLLRGLMNFQSFKISSYILSQDWSFGKQLSLFPSNLNVSLGSATGTLRFSENKKNIY